MLKCKVCREKERLIDQLKAEVAYLRQLAIPQNDPFNLPKIVLEADQALTGSEEPTPAEGDSPDEARQHELTEEEKAILGEY